MMRRNFFTEMSTNINTATREQLSALPGIDDKKAGQLQDNRPFRSWDDISSLPGFSEEITDNLRNSGAVLLP
ncbi:MAG: ComEA family DNA-binding protein [Chitinivibrionales bacterium]